MQALQRFFNLLRLDRKDIYQLFFYALFSGLISLSLPLGIQAIVNFIQSGRMSVSWAILVTLVVMGVAFNGYLSLMQLRITENIQQKIFVRAGLLFAYRLPRLKMETIQQVYPPQLANRFMDTLTIQKGTSKLLLDFSAALLQIVFGLLLLALYHPLFILFGIGVLALLYFIFKLSFKAGLETSLSESKYKYKILGWLQEIARNTFSFRRENQLQFGLQKTDDLLGQYLNYREKHFAIIRQQNTRLIGFKVLITAGLLGLGGLLVVQQQLNIGQFVAAEIVIVLVINSVEKIILGLETFYDVLTSIDKIDQVMQMPLEEEASHEEQATNADCILEAKDAVYHYSSDKNRSLGPLHFKMEQGEKILISGDNGSGKSTLLKMLSGYVRPHDGSFQVYDVLLQKVPIQNFRSELGVVLSGDVPFEGTLWENITYLQPNVDKEAVRWAVDLVGMTDFVTTLEHGYDTPIIAEGRQLSTSIAQRIVLARAIVHRPKWLFLESPLSHLDAPDAQLIISKLAAADMRWTLVVISKNPSWKSMITRELTLQNGKIVSDQKY
ncbi:MAG: ABC transporter ATP-binding protein/permease [Flavobacterium sp. BFFFF2]|nr:MAG: ABC transporter ATP-binding protein/permease [Flavobacterium sp. BFFFF2]